MRQTWLRVRSIARLFYSVRNCVAWATITLVVTGKTSHGQSTLSGSVISDVGERKLSGAEVSIVDLAKSTHSDSAGQFRLGGISDGTHRLIVRLAGFRPWDGMLEFHAGEPMEIDVILEPVPVTLPTEEVKSAASPTDSRLAGFVERRRTGLGRFLGPELFQQNADRPLASVLLERVPGIRITSVDGNRVVFSSQDGKPKCMVQVIVNNAVVYTGRPGESPFDIGALQSGDVLAAEYYTVASTPPRFNSTGGGAGATAGAACGTLVITRK